MIDLDDIEARCKAATPGPWGLDEDVEELGGISGIYYGPDDPPVAELLRADAEFIVAARTLLPEALDRIEALERLVEEAREIMERDRRLEKYIWHPDEYAERRDAWLAKADADREQAG